MAALRDSKLKRESLLLQVLLQNFSLSEVYAASAGRYQLICKRVQDRMLVWPLIFSVLPCLAQQWGSA